MLFQIVFIDSLKGSNYHKSTSEGWFHVCYIILQEFTERILESYLAAHYIMLTVPSSVYSRHEMTNGASCLCYLLENSILRSDVFSEM